MVAVFQGELAPSGCQSALLTCFEEFSVHFSILVYLGPILSSTNILVLEVHHVKLHSEAGLSATKTVCPLASLLSFKNLLFAPHSALCPGQAGGLWHGKRMALWVETLAGPEVLAPSTAAPWYCCRWRGVQENQGWSQECAQVRELEGRRGKDFQQWMWGLDQVLLGHLVRLSPFLMLGLGLKAPTLLVSSGGDAPAIQIVWTLLVNLRRPHC